MYIYDAIRLETVTLQPTWSSDLVVRARQQGKSDRSEQAAEAVCVFTVSGFLLFPSSLVICLELLLCIGLCLSPVSCFSDQFAATSTSQTPPVSGKQCAAFGDSRYLRYGAKKIRRAPLTQQSTSKTMPGAPSVHITGRRRQRPCGQLLPVQA